MEQFRKKDKYKKCVCLPYFKFSDLLPQTYLFLLDLISLFENQRYGTLHDN